MTSKKLVRFVISCLFLVSVEAAEFVEVTIPPSVSEDELQIGLVHTLWIPEGVETLRGIIVHQHGCGVGACKGGETAAYDLHWQELARKWDCALLGPSYQQAEEQSCRLWCDPRNGSGEVFVRALEELAQKSGHAELATVPWCLWGHSGGGFWASLMQMEYPERIAAIFFQSGTAHSRWVSGEIEKPEIPDAAMGIPMIACPGFKERGHERFRVAYDGCYAMVRDYRSRGAPIAFCPDPKTNHETGDSRYLAIPFFDACLAMRLPEKAGSGELKAIDLSSGVLRPLHENYVDPSDSKDAGEGETNWFPNEVIAKAGEEFLRTGAVADTTPPPAPSDVKLSGNEISWSARADFESGLQAFLILRDGKEIGRVPKESKKRFGRPLFQQMSYHDTPEAPLPEMKFVDENASTNASDYEVIAINSVGLRSDGK